MNQLRPPVPCAAMTNEAQRTAVNQLVHANFLGLEAPEITVLACSERPMNPTTFISEAQVCANAIISGDCRNFRNRLGTLEPISNQERVTKPKYARRPKL